MGGRYVPPARRGQEQSEEQSQDTSSSSPTKESSTTNLPIRSLEQLSLTQPQSRREGPPGPRRNRYCNWTDQPRPRLDGEFTSEEIYRYYWPTTATSTSTTTTTNILEATTATTEEGPTPKQQSTLNDSELHKGQLTYIRLFPGANPRWDSDCIIFAHTSIEILPGYVEAFAGAEDAAAAGDGGDMDGISTAETTRGRLPRGRQSAVEFIQGTTVSSSSENDNVTGKTNIPSSSLPETDENPAITQTGDRQSTLELNQSTTDSSEENNTTNNDHNKDATTSLPSTTPSNTTPLLTHPIAVFTQTHPPRSGSSSIYFRFTGWYHLRNIDFLHPGSADLTRMMQQKWEHVKDRRGRDVQREKSAWAKSMSQRWAVCKFEEIQGEALLLPPAIQMIGQDEG
ncbi:MAG: hypothetical protein GOMPHAMPRED_004548 [Gomphillus americanus]|uniref:Uncharacterized protein n=1 Tax=Gomphillus americanus TaxID=1940652 RepID=A0A8H3FV28_9LECA|nr:MAG: hypothetical protein GOMPHAMPRED_004548 [Gomphillus americanus]